MHNAHLLIYSVHQNLYFSYVCAIHTNPKAVEQFTYLAKDTEFTISKGESVVIYGAIK